ncbi:MAG: hypothetical protein AB7Y46_04340 [Armatimonadota bacterium]
MRTFVIVLLVLMPCAAALAQEQAPPPWETWQPPVVEMPDPNAWDIYERAAQIESAIQERLAGELPGGTPTSLDMSEASLEPETLAMLIEAYAPVFSALEAAIAGDTVAPPITSREDIERAFPEFANLRQFARMFASRSIYHLSQDDPLSAALDAIAAVHIGADVGTHNSLIGGLVQIACAAIGEARLREAIPLLEPDAARIATNALRAAMAELPDLARALRGEETLSRLLMREQFPGFAQMGEAVQALREDPEYARQILAQEDPAFADLDDEAVKAKVEEKIAEMAALTPEVAWAELGRFYAAQQAEAAKPYWAREPVAPPANILLKALLSPFDAAALKYAVSDARLNVDLAAIAAQAYFGEHGAYPTDLAALAPDYLPAVPRDPFTDAPLSAQIREPISRAHPAAQREPGGARVLVIYSVGPDGDDDGGADIGRVAEADSDGDIAITLTAR